VEILNLTNEGVIMNAITLKKVVCFSALLLTIGASAYGAQPPDVVQSDANGNTAMGNNALLSNNTGSGNTASGDSALISNTSGSYNTASGIAALGRNTTGVNNIAFGAYALGDNTIGVNNTASGVNALRFNTTGESNTASGAYALFSNTTGSVNTAFGTYALTSNTTGVNNTATGVGALGHNATGSENTASGVNALSANTTGNGNTAVGSGALTNNLAGENNTSIGQVALNANTTGFTNSAVGGYALASNTTGAQNTAIGGAALLSNTTGDNNIAFGMNAGSNLTTGNSNITIGNTGAAGEGGTIRIGATGQQSRTFIAGIWGSRVRKGASVVVTSTGQLGIEESSERYKTDIASMGPRSEAIQRLRPVTYRLKTDPAGDLQYGLIAEEVNQVYPELVVRDDAGQIEGVRYDRFAPILISEIQQQQRTMAAQAEQLGELKQQFAELQELNLSMRAALIALEAEKSRVAMR
jgi:trimeric autotransporter adhesin